LNPGERAHHRIITRIVAAELRRNADDEGDQCGKQYLVRVDLAGFDEELKDAGARQFVEIAQSFRGAATPAYKSCRWAAQDEKNRRWIEELKSRLATDEQKIAPRLEQRSLSEAAAGLVEALRKQEKPRPD
jgi:hypothetical protein